MGHYENILLGRAQAPQSPPLFGGSGPGPGWPACHSHDNRTGTRIRADSDGPRTLMARMQCRSHDNRIGTRIRADSDPSADSDSDGRRLGWTQTRMDSDSDGLRLGWTLLLSLQDGLCRLRVGWTQTRMDADSDGLRLGWTQTRMDSDSDGLSCSRAPRNGRRTRMGGIADGWLAQAGRLGDSPRPAGSHRPARSLPRRHLLLLLLA